VTEPISPGIALDLERIFKLIQHDVGPNVYMHVFHSDKLVFSANKASITYTIKKEAK